MIATLLLTLVLVNGTADLQHGTLNVHTSTTQIMGHAEGPTFSPLQTSWSCVPACFTYMQAAYDWGSTLTQGEITYTAGAYAFQSYPGLTLFATYATPGLSLLTPPGTYVLPVALALDGVLGIPGQTLEHFHLLGQGLWTIEIREGVHSMIWSQDSLVFGDGSAPPVMNPEPASLALLGTGVLWFIKRRLTWAS